MTSSTKEILAETIVITIIGALFFVATGRRLFLEALNYDAQQVNCPAKVK